MAPLATLLPFLLLLLTTTFALPQSATATSLALSPTCTSGPPASPQSYAGTDDNTAVITDYTLVQPQDAHGSGYSVHGEWYAEHLVSGPHWMGYTHASDPYGPSKCQYLCNAAAEGCASFFAWYVDVDTESEHMNCVLFDAVITPDIFVFTNGTIASGGYDRICRAD